MQFVEKECGSEVIDLMVIFAAITQSRKKKYINMLADNQISQADYSEMIEDNNEGIDQLVEKKNELL